MGFDAVCCALRRGIGQRPRNENNGCGIHFVALIWAESAKLGTRDERNSGYFHFVADSQQKESSGRSVWIMPRIGQAVIETCWIFADLHQKWRFLGETCVFSAGLHHRRPFSVVHLHLLLRHSERNALGLVPFAAGEVGEDDGH